MHRDRYTDLYAVDHQLGLLAVERRVSMDRIDNIIIYTRVINLKRQFYYLDAR